MNRAGGAYWHAWGREGSSEQEKETWHLIYSPIVQTVIACTSEHITITVLHAHIVQSIGIIVDVVAVFCSCHSPD